MWKWKIKKLSTEKQNQIKIHLKSYTPGRGVSGSKSLCLKLIEL